VRGRDLEHFAADPVHAACALDRPRQIADGDEVARLRAFP